MPSTFTVNVQGTISVPVDTAMLELMGDPSLCEEITVEAIRIGVSDRLGGFGDFVLEKVTPSATLPVPRKGKAPTHVAMVNFNGLADSLGQVQAQYEAAAEALKATKEAIEVCMGKVGTASIDELRSMLETLLITSNSGLEEALAEQPPPLTRAEDSDEQEADGEETEGEADASSEGSYGSYERERALMGYQPLIDGDDDDEDH